MLATEPSYLHKVFYDRGVDIGVGVATSFFVGFIGLLFWRGKLLLDEWRQRQELRIAAEFEAKEREQKLQALRDRLGRERDGFAEVAINATSGQQLARLWENFLGWMERNDLRHLPGNQATLTTHRDWSNGLRGFTHPYLKEQSDKMVELIRNTELP